MYRIAIYCFFCRVRRLDGFLPFRSLPISKSHKFLASPLGSSKIVSKFSIFSCFSSSPFLSPIFSSFSSAFLSLSPPDFWASPPPSTLLTPGKSTVSISQYFKNWIHHHYPLSVNSIELVWVPCYRSQYAIRSSRKTKEDSDKQPSD